MPLYKRIKRRLVSSRNASHRIRIASYQIRIPQRIQSQIGSPYQQLLPAFDVLSSVIATKPCNWTKRRRQRRWRRRCEQKRHLDTYTHTWHLSVCVCVCLLSILAMGGMNWSIFERWLLLLLIMHRVECRRWKRNKLHTFRRFMLHFNYIDTNLKCVYHSNINLFSVYFKLNRKLFRKCLLL